MCKTARQERTSASNTKPSDSAPTNPQGHKKNTQTHPSLSLFFTIRIKNRFIEYPSHGYHLQIKGPREGKEQTNIMSEIIRRVLRNATPYTIKKDDFRSSVQLDKCVSLDTRESVDKRIQEVVLLHATQRVGEKTVVVDVPYPWKNTQKSSCFFSPLSSLLLLTFKYVSKLNIPKQKTLLWINYELPNYNILLCFPIGR